jgi:hypothetical protein
MRLDDAGDLRFGGRSALRATFGSDELWTPGGSGGEPVQLVEWKFAADTGTPVFTLDTPTEPGDLLVVCQSRRASSAAAFPSGWAVANTGGSGLHITVRQGYRLSAGGETVIDGFSFGSGRHHLTVLRGVDETDPLVDSANAYNGEGSSVTVPAMAAVPGALLVGGWGSGRGVTYWGTYPTTHPVDMEHVHRWNTSNDAHPVLVGVESLEGSATEPRTATSSNTNNFSAVVGTVWRPKGS